MKPIVLFGIQFTLSLVAYWLIAFWYVAPRLSGLPPELALAPLLWVHAFRIVGGTILAPGAVGPGVPMEFRTMIGYGDLITALLAAVLHLVTSRLAEAATTDLRQIATASSSNATARRMLTGSSMASS